MERLKEHKGILILTSIIILSPVLIGLLLWNQLPAEVATHFGSDGQPNGWSSREFAVFGLPLFVLACHLLCSAATFADPKYNRINGKVFKLILWICPFVSLFCAIATYGYALNSSLNIDSFGKAFVGIIFIILGNYLPKCRQNYTIGIKLPWTLHDEENWNRTHRMAGWLWMAGGVLLILLMIFNIGNIFVFLGMMFVMVSVPVIYSYIYYLKHNK